VISHRVRNVALALAATGVLAQVAGEMDEIAMWVRLNR